MFYFYCQNCSNAPLIRKSLKVEHTIEALRPFRILGNLGEIKYKGGISTKCPVSFLENQQTSSLYCSWSKKNKYQTRSIKIVKSTIFFFGIASCKKSIEPTFCS